MSSSPQTFPYSQVCFCMMNPLWPHKLLTRAALYSRYALLATCFIEHPFYTLIVMERLFYVKLKGGFRGKLGEF